MPKNFNLFERASDLSLEKVVENLKIDKTEYLSDYENEEMLANLNSNSSSSPKQVKEPSKLFCSFLISLKFFDSFTKVLQLTHRKFDLS